MADLNAIIVGQSGKVYTAPIGTDVPTDATSSWPTGWADLGTIAEDGLTESFNEDTTEIKQWGGGTVRKLITGSEVTYAFICLESNREVIERFRKTTMVSDTEVKVRRATRDERMWGMDVLDGLVHVRFVIERGEITERGDVVYKADQAAQYEFTVTAYEDDDGVVATQYSDSDSWASA